MAPQKDHLRLAASKVAFDNPELARRLIATRDVGDTPFSAALNPRVYDVSAPLMANQRRGIF